MKSNPLPIVALTRGTAAPRDKEYEFITTGEVADLFSLAKKSQRVTEFLAAIGIHPTGVHLYAGQYYPLWNRKEVLAVHEKRRREADEAIAKAAKPVAAPAVAPAPVQEGEDWKQKASDLNTVLLRIAELKRQVEQLQRAPIDFQPVLRAVSDSEVRMRQVIVERVSPLVDMLAELDGRISALTKECGALLAHINSSK